MWKMYVMYNRDVALDVSAGVEVQAVVLLCSVKEVLCTGGVRGKCQLGVREDVNWEMVIVDQHKYKQQ